MPKTKAKAFYLTLEEQDALVEAGMMTLRQLKEDDGNPSFTPDQSYLRSLIAGLDKLGCNIDWGTLDPEAM